MPVCSQKHRRTTGDTSESAGRTAGQMGWYNFAAQLISEKTVLDVGCGLGDGLEVLKSVAKIAVGQEIDQRLASEHVMITPISEIPENAYDVVICIDVIEHVEDDTVFIAELCRIAREFVFVTTPLWVRGRKIWPYHIREYTVREFLDLVHPHGGIGLYKGSPSGKEVYEVKYLSLFLILNDLVNNIFTNIPVRVLQKLLPVRARNQAHQAAVIWSEQKIKP